MDKSLIQKLKKNLFQLIILSSLFFNAALFADQENFVINGKPSANSAWPFMVSLSTADTSADKGHFCGGVLITSRHVLTAAHCVVDYVNFPSLVRVAIGRTKLTSTEGREIIADGIVVYPEYKIEEFSNDVAIVRLSEEVDITPIKIAAQNDSNSSAAGSPATLLGWGVMDQEYLIRPDNLQEATLDIIDDSECEHRLGLDFQPNTMLCAGKLATNPFTSDGVDACYGDSGGPLIAQTADGIELIGLVSWGWACGSDKYWGVYAEVSKYSDWIQSLPGVKPYSVDLPYVNGEPEVGSKLTCETGQWGGDGPLQYIYRWYDNIEGLVRESSSPNYKLTKRDIGRTLVCEVSASNEYGENLSVSEEVGPIFPTMIPLPLKGASRTLKSFAYSCNGKKCKVLLSVRNPEVEYVSALFVPTGRNCSRKNPKETCHTKHANYDWASVSANSWLFQLRRDLSENYDVFIRIVFKGKDKVARFKIPLRLR